MEALTSKDLAAILREAGVRLLALGSKEVTLTEVVAIGRAADLLERLPVEPLAAPEHVALVDELFNASRLWSKAMQQTLTIKQTEAQARLDAARAAVLNALRASEPPSVGPLKLDNDRQVFFYEQDHYYLSNFSAFFVEIDGHMYPTSEHAYHCYKFPDPTMQSAIRRASSAHEAFKMAERWKPYRIPDWDNVKADVMRRILRAKVDQHEYVRRKLLETGERELVENSWRDDVWGWGPNRDGENLLGKLWMEIRDELRASPTKEPVPSNGCGCEGACAKRMGHEVQGECAADEHERSGETSGDRNG